MCEPIPLLKPRPRPSEEDVDGSDGAGRDHPPDPERPGPGHGHDPLLLQEAASPREEDLLSEDGHVRDSAVPSDARQEHTGRGIKYVEHADMLDRAVESMLACMNIL